MDWLRLCSKNFSRTPLSCMYNCAWALQTVTWERSSLTLSVGCICKLGCREIPLLNMSNVSNGTVSAISPKAIRVTTNSSCQSLGGYSITQCWEVWFKGKGTKMNIKFCIHLNINNALHLFTCRFIRRGISEDVVHPPSLHHSYWNAYIIP